MIKVEGYRAVATLHEGRRTQVLRGVREVDGAPVVIKALRHEHPPLRDVARLRHEYAVLQRFVGLDVLVENAAAMDDRERLREAAGEREEVVEVEAVRRDPRPDRRPAEVLEDEGDARPGLDEAERADARTPGSRSRSASA